VLICASCGICQNCRAFDSRRKTALRYSPCGYCIGTATRQKQVNNPSAKDALKIQLSLYYAGLNGSDRIAKQIIESSFAVRAEKLLQDKTPT
jgi:hypothetical protein